MSIKKRNLSEKIINIVLNVLIFIFGIILLVAIYNGIQVKLLGKDYSDFFGYSTFEVKTGSMADYINIGDWIIVKNNTTPKIKDVITFEQDGEFITHRVVEAYNGTYVTMGDANNSKDNPISESQIVGKVVKILPHFGIIRKTIFNPFVLFALIITIYVISFVIKKNKSDNDEANKKIDNLLEALIKKVQIFIKNLKKVKTEKEKSIKEKIVKEKKEVKEEIKSVNVNNDDALETNYDIEELKQEAMSEEDMDKTMFFRSISVDKSEIDDTYLKIAETKISDAKEIVQEDIDLDDESIIKKNLESLQKKKNKKCKNIIEKSMLIKTEELNEIVDYINRNEKPRVNEPTIKDEFLKAYIDVKYYNYCGDENVEYNKKNMTKRIENALDAKAIKLVKDYKGNDKNYNEKIKKYLNMFVLIMQLEQASEVIEELQPKRELYRKKIIKFLMGESIPVDDANVKDIVNKIIKTQKIYKGMIEYSLKKLETNMFKADLTQLSTIKKVYAVALKHNIAFSKVYSDYIVDKTYTEGIIAEDKIVVLLSLLLVQLTKDMFQADFKNKYLIYMPETLYAKENKLNKILKMMDDEYAKTSIIIAIKYNDLINNKKVVKSLRKLGYQFAIVFDKTTDIKAKDEKILYVANYMFMDKKVVKVADMLPSIPKDIQDKLVYESLLEKVENIGGE